MGVPILVVNGVRVAATTILRNPAAYGTAAVTAAKEAIKKLGASGLGGIARDVGGTIAAGTLWDAGQEAYGWIVDNVFGDAAGAGTAAPVGGTSPDIGYDVGENLDSGGDLADAGYDLDELVGHDVIDGTGGVAGGVYNELTGGQRPYALGSDGASVVIQGPTVANQKFQLVPTITREAEDWLRDNLTARGWSREQVADPYLLAACMVAQGMCPPPSEVMVPMRARDWLSSTGFGDGSTSLAHSRKDSAFEYACKYGIKVALAVRLGLAYVDRYQARKSSSKRRYTATTTTTTTRRRPAATVKRTTTTKKRR